MPKAINLLGFDFGSKRIGVAFASNPHTQPIAITPLSARDGIPDWQQVKNLVDEWQTQAFVVGIPYNMDGSVGEMAHRARKFANRLSSKFGRPSYIVDERLTTYEAKQLYLAGEPTNKDSVNWERHSVDSIAAQLIVSAWFDEPSHRLASLPFSVSPTAWK